MPPTSQNPLAFGSNPAANRASITSGRSSECCAQWIHSTRARFFFNAKEKRSQPLSWLKATLRHPLFEPPPAKSLALIALNNLSVADIGSMLVIWIILVDMAVPMLSKIVQGAHRKASLSSREPLRLIFGNRAAFFAQSDLALLICHTIWHGSIPQRPRPRASTLFCP